MNSRQLIKVLATLVLMVASAGPSFGMPEDSKAKGEYPLLRPGLNNAFTGWLQIFEEKPLSQLKCDELIFRRIKLPAFKDSVCMRLEFGKEKARVTVKIKEKPMVGEKPVDIEVSKFELSKQETESIKGYIDKVRSQFDKPSENNIGNDGECILYEIFENGEHKYAERWSPENTALKELNLELNSFTHRKK
ncbi:hypothetical protein KA183_06085 [bacterium]|nr:hypothetical protein [bacterium]